MLSSPLHSSTLSQPLRLCPAGWRQKSWILESGYARSLPTATPYDCPVGRSAPYPGTMQHEPIQEPSRSWECQASTHCKERTQVAVRFWGEELPGPGTSIRKYAQCLERPSSTITQSSRCQRAHNKQGQGTGFLKLEHDLEVEWQNGSGPESGRHGLWGGPASPGQILENQPQTWESESPEAGLRNSHCKASRHHL